MRSSTSRFRPALLFLAGTLALAAVPYTHWIALAPLSEDRLAEAFPTTPTAAPATGEPTYLYRAECLAGALIRPESYCTPVALTTEDDPFDFVDKQLLAARPPKRIVVMEDSTFFLFARRPQANSAPAAAPALELPVDAVPGATGARPPTFEEYLTRQRRQKDRDDQHFRRGLREASLLDPLTVRKLIGGGAGWLVQQVTPALVVPQRFASNLVAGYLKYIRAGADNELVSAWQAYRMTLPVPALREALRHLLVGRFTVESYPFEMTPDSCFAQTYVEDRVAPTPPYERYPVVAALRRAQAMGAEIRVVLLPYNEHVERSCRPSLRAFEQAIREVAIESGWPLDDLRATSVPAMAELGNFDDRFHLIMHDNPRFQTGFAGLFAKAAGLDRGCLPQGE